MERLNQKTKTTASIIACIALVVLLILSYTNTGTTSMLRSVLQLGSIYALAAASMNLLNGFTGLFSLGHAGFMAIGAYTYAVLTIPVNRKANVYYLYGVADGLANVALPTWLGLIIGGIAAAIVAAIIGAAVLRLKSDYFAIATLGLAEIVRICVASSPMARITNGSLGLKNIPGFTDIGPIPAYFVPFIVVTICLVIMFLLINCSYGRAFKAIREDEIAAEAMGINLARHKQMSFIISSFFAGIAGALLAMFLGAIQSTTFPLMLTYNILLIVVIGGMGSLSGSIFSAFLVIAAKEWWLRFLDVEHYIGDWQVPLLRTGFRMVVFSIILMVVVLFWRQGIMGQKEFSWDGIYNFFRRFKNKTGGKNKKAAAAAGGDVNE